MGILDCGGGGYGQLVAAVIHRVVRMSLDPDETDPVTAVDLQKANPEIGIEPFLEPFALPAVLTESTTYLESLYRIISALGRLTASSPTMTAVSSIRLLVVSGKPSESSL